MEYLVLGVFIGTVLGIFISSMCIASKEANRYMEEAEESREYEDR